MSIFPEDYQSPKPISFYTELKEGENRIRILSKPIFGWEDWYEKKPVRYTTNEKPTKSFDPTKKIKFFVAFVVYNHTENEIQIMNITQTSIRRSIEMLNADADWGSPFNYDIKIIRSGKGIDTKYSVNPISHKPVSQDIIDAFNDRRCNLNALFSNADPFSKEWNEYTELATIETTNPANLGVSFENISELKEMFYECDPEYQKSLLLTLAKLPKPVKKIEDVPLSMFERIKQAVTLQRLEYRAKNHDIFAVA